MKAGQEKSFSSNHILKTRILWILAVLGLGWAVSLEIPRFLDFVFSSGYQIYSDDLKQDYAYGILCAFFLFWMIALIPVEKKERQVLLCLWVVKSFVTLGLMLFYEGYYGLDAFGYHLDGTTQLDYLKLLRAGSGTLFVTGLVSFLAQHFPLFTSYHALKVLFSLFGLLGSYLLFRAGVRLTGEYKLKNLFFLGLFPSVLFWGSILGKDPLIFCFISLYAFGVISWFKTKNSIYLLVIFLGIGLSSVIRLWMAPILLLPLALHQLVRPGSWAPKLITSALLFFIFIQFSTRMADYFKIESMDDVLDQTHAISRSWSRGGSAQEVPELTDFQSIAAFAPSAMFAALFRPLPGEVMNPFGLLAGFESMGLLLLLIYAFWLVRGRFWKDEIFLWCLSTTTIWSAVYGFISYQNLGAGFRFRLQVMPFMLLLLLHVFYRKARPIFSLGIKR